MRMQPLPWLAQVATLELSCLRRHPSQSQGCAS
ncbi:Uncharacterised protein [Vibrio cholerae]|nr:Uncharacterised protein [Vibrio cholerae]